MRLTTACHAVQYYKTIDREIIPVMMRGENTLKNFHEALKALQTLANKTAPDVPCISRAMPVMKWAPVFELVIESIYGTRDFLPLMYVIRKEQNPADPSSPLIPNIPYLEKHGSLQGELIARAENDHVILMKIMVLYLMLSS